MDSQMAAADRTILIVDDRQPNRAYLSTVLGSRGYRTLEAEDGVGALELLRTHHPDLVLADILMPRMDGYEFVRHARSDPGVAETPIVLLTAHYLEGEARALANTLGVAGIMTKPIEPQVIITTVERVLKAREGARGPVPAPGPQFGLAGGAATFEVEHRRLLTDTLARKATQLEAANDQLLGLVALGRQLASERNPKRLLSLFVHAGGNLLDAEYAVVAVLEAEPQSERNEPHSPAPQIKHIVANGLEPAIVGRISGQGVVAGLLKQHGTTAHVSLIEQPSRPGADAVPRELQTLGPLVIAPIATASCRYGLFVFVGVTITDESRDMICSLAQSMGAVLGVAYENAIRYEQIELHAARLQDEIAERRLAQDRVARLNAELEQRVLERTGELERAHESLRQSERMASLGTLCAGLGHDMGNLLLPIRVRLGLIEELVSDGDDREQEEPPANPCVDHVQAIHECIRYIGDLTGGLRLLAIDPEEPNSEPATTELGAWWEQVRPLMRSALPRGFELDAQFTDEPIVLGMARHRLTQAVFNLVQNAADAMRDQTNPAPQGDAPSPKFPRVTIRGRMAKRRAKPAETAGDAAFVLEVADNGPGMPDDVRRHALEPFFTTKARERSTGLGLSLVHGIVTAAGGAMEIESECTRGTTVKLTLPLAPAAVDDADAVPPERRPVAIVSIAQERQRAIFTSILELTGYRVSRPPLAADQRPAPSFSDRLADEQVALWLTEPSHAPPEQVERFVAGRQDRKVVVVGPDDERLIELGCLPLGAAPTPGELRARLKAIFTAHHRQPVNQPDAAVSA